MPVEAILFYLLLIDSIGCNLVAWYGERWYAKHETFPADFPPVPRHEGLGGVLSEPDPLDRLAFVRAGRLF